MLATVVNKVYDILEPRLKELIREAVDEAVKDISAEVESLPGKLLDDITKLPVFGFLRGSH